MSTKKSYAVFGLGKYGEAVAKELSDRGMDVLAVDIDPKTVEDAVGILPVCKCADVTDPEVLEQLGIADIDVVIIAMASNLEASVLAVTLCRELGVGQIIAKCANETHRMILQRVGADSVVFPEHESGVRLAKNLLSSGFVDMISLSDEVSVVELDVKDEWVGKNLIELNLRKRYSVNVVAMKRNGTVDVEVNPELPLESGMTLIAIVNTKKLSKLK